MARDIDFFFAAGSPWAYLGLAPMRDLAARHDITFVPRPITLIEANGAIYSKNRPEPRKRYWLQDLARWAELRGKPLDMADRGGLAAPDPAAFTIIAAALDGKDWFALTERLQRGFWEEKADIGTSEVRSALATEAGLDGATLLARENDADVRAAFEDNMAVALEAGVFGAPTFRCDGELFWGQDSLPFLEKALQAK